MINVTDLACFIYCKRKLYLKRVLGFKPKPTKQMIVGRVKHRAQELMFKNELQTLKEVKSPNINNVKKALTKNLKNAIERAISESDKEIRHFKINTFSINEQLFFAYRKFILDRSFAITHLMQTKNLSGEALANALYPRFMSEVNLSSKSFALKGKVDLIEEQENKLVPVELKTGLAPKNRIWPHDRIQLIAYTLLTKENFKKPVDHAKLIYLQEQKTIKLQLNAFMPYEIKSPLS